MLPKTNRKVQWNNKYPSFNMCIFLMLNLKKNYEGDPYL